MENIGSVIIFIGILLVLFGVVWSVGGKYLGFGKLPGDFSYEGKSFKFYFPFGSSIVISVLLTIVFLMFNYLRR